MRVVEHSYSVIMNLERTFLRAMEMAMVTGPNPLDLAAFNTFTFFVPTDDAFEAVGGETFAQSSNLDATSILANHVVPGLFNSDAFKPDLVYKLPSLISDLAVQRTKNDTIKVHLYI